MIGKAKQINYGLNIFPGALEQLPHACRLRCFLVNEATNKRSIQFPRTNAETGRSTKSFVA